MRYWAIYHEGKQITPPMPEYKAKKRYRELSECVLNLDLRMLQPAGEEKSAREVIKTMMRVVGD